MKNARPQNLGTSARDKVNFTAIHRCLIQACPYLLPYAHPAAALLLLAWAISGEVLA